MAEESLAFQGTPGQTPGSEKEKHAASVRGTFRREVRWRMGASGGRNRKWEGTLGLKERGVPGRRGARPQFPQRRRPGASDPAGLAGGSRPPQPRAVRAPGSGGGPRRPGHQGLSGDLSRGARGEQPGRAGAAPRRDQAARRRRAHSRPGRDLAEGARGAAIGSGGGGPGRGARAERRPAMGARGGLGS